MAFSVPPHCLRSLPEPVRSSSPGLSEKGILTWTTDGPLGGDILDIATDGESLYVATMMNGVWFAGSSGWEARRNGIEFLTVNTLLGLRPRAVLAGTEGAGLWKTQTAGANWAQDTLFPDSAVVKILFRFNPQYIFAGTEVLGTYCSADTGRTWFKLTSLPDSFCVVSFTRDYLATPNLLAATQYHGIWRSADLGATWLPSTAPVGVGELTKILFIPGAPDYTYLGAIDGLFIQAGGNWSGTTLANATIMDIVRRGDSMYVATAGGGVYYAPLGDTVFQPVNTGLPYTIVSTLESIVGNIYAGTTGGFFYQTGNNPWAEYNDDLHASLIYDLCVNPQNNAAMFASSFGGGLYKSTDNGITWFRPPTEPPLPIVTAFAVNPLDSNEIVCASIFGVYKTINHGVTWTLYPYSGWHVATAIRYHPADPSILYLCTNDYLYRSTDGAQNWTTIDVPGHSYQDIAITPSNPQVLYVARDDGVIISQDGGNTFISSGLNGVLVYAVAVDGFNSNMIYAGLEPNGGYPVGVYRSQDYGQSWSATAYPPENAMALKTIVNVPFFAAAANVESNCFFTLTGGDVWYPVGPYLPDNQSTVVDFNPATHTMFFGNYSGVLALTDTTRPRLTLAAPDSFSPDGDSIRDNAVFHVTALDTTGILYWCLRIVRDSINYFVFDGFGAVPESLTWDGYDSLGRLARNGTYDCYWSALDGFMNLSTASRPFVMNKKPMVSGVGKATASIQGRKIAVDRLGFIHAVYTTFNPEEVFYTRSADGSIWAEPENLSNSRYDYSTNPAIALDTSNTVYIFWEEECQADSHDLVYQRRLGNNWLPGPRRVTRSAEVSTRPSVSSVANGDLHLAWQEATEIYYKHYNFTSGQWDSALNISGTVGASREPFLVYRPGSPDLYVLWSDNTNSTNFDIRYRRWNGAVWLAESVLVLTAGNSLEPSAIADPNGFLHVFWSDSILGTGPDILYKQFRSDSGWGAEVNLTQNLTRSVRPTASIDYANNVFLFWNEPNDIYLRIKDRQLGWLDTINVSSDPAQSANPSSAFSNRLVWTDGDHAPYRIMYRFIATTDSTPPRFTITGADTAYLNAPYQAYFAVDEPLTSLPTAWLANPAGDSVWFTVIQDSALHYTGMIGTVPGTWPAGSGLVRVRGQDLAGNPGFQERGIFLADSSDITPPRLTLAAPDTAFIGDTLVIAIHSNEDLDSLPSGCLFDVDQDSLVLSVIEDSMRFYRAKVLVAGVAAGAGSFSVHARDIHGNAADTTQGIQIASRGRLLPPDSCFAYPNPTRQDYVRFMFYVNQNADVEFEIYTLAGRRIHEIPAARFDGGLLHTLTMSVVDLGRDIYIFRCIARAGTVEETVLKKFGVIR